MGRFYFNATCNGRLTQCLRSTSKGFALSSTRTVRRHFAWRWM